MKLIVDMPIGADLVDRAVLYERLKQWQDAAYDTVTLAFLHEVKMLIGSAPHIKAVELVRCKDCVHRDPEDKRCDCGGHEWVKGKILPVKDDWFCADGERKEGNRK
jgi:hypothetical protein